MGIEDYLHPFKNTYRVSPVWFKRCVGQVYAFLPMSIRYGRILGQAREFLDKSQWWSLEEHQNYQWQQMKNLICHTYANVPYYKRIMKQAKLTPDDFNSFSDWAKLPLLTKNMVRSHQKELVADNMRNKLLATNTGGSTGEPLELYWERGRTRSLERAFMWRQWAWGGFEYGQRTVILRGQTVKEGLWHYDPIDKHLFVNMYNLSEKSFPRIIKKLREFKPVSIQAYPSTLTLLAGWMQSRNEAPIASVKTLLCGSENMYAAQKELFKQVFQARVYSWYGHGESCCLAGYCDSNDYYHVYSEYGYMELVDAEGNVLPWEPGQRGEIVGTSLINNAMPLIRYRTGDIGIVGPPKCSCGRNYKLLAKVEGRKQEYVITSDGRAIALTGMIFGQHWHAFAKIKQIQLVQNDPGKIVVKVAKGANYGSEDEQEIKQKMLDCAKTGLNVEFDYVDNIPLTRRGKHIFIKQSLDIPSAWSGSCEDNQPESHEQ